MHAVQGRRGRRGGRQLTRDEADKSSEPMRAKTACATPGQIAPPYVANLLSTSQWEASPATAASTSAPTSPACLLENGEFRAQWSEGKAPKAGGAAKPSRTWVLQAASRAQQWRSAKTSQASASSRALAKRASLPRTGDGTGRPRRAPAACATGRDSRHRRQAAASTAAYILSIGAWCSASARPCPHVRANRKVRAGARVGAGGRRC